MNTVHVVDARGMRCPWPALRAAKAMRAHNEVLILADDPIAPGELEALASRRGWQYMTVDDSRGPAFMLVSGQIPQ
ncbi:hypothetical protein C1T17_19405 [Sphingobium sp. SCG-1]|uniref:sulfurtransferase TusA family protein n=1 Tax=Sphingobium sp. SCG-1 TaxID=2072936 RepID=UPI000CD67833|nr:sulfurtransferase TusA family protein [Sphingobium sp. SCG-1]AUW59922.1 hypothetical protein C1T17_19405 [Sphingobium sp. SCG-1]